MKRFWWMYILIGMFIFIHSYASRDISKDIYYLGYGQVVIERDKRFNMYTERKVIKRSFKNRRAINIVENNVSDIIFAYMVNLWSMEN